MYSIDSSRTRVGYWQQEQWSCLFQEKETKRKKKISWLNNQCQIKIQGRIWHRDHTVWMEEAMALSGVWPSIPVKWPSVGVTSITSPTFLLDLRSQFHTQKYRAVFRISGVQLQFSSVQKLSNKEKLGTCTNYNFNSKNIPKYNFTHNLKARFY